MWSAWSDCWFTLSARLVRATPPPGQTKRCGTSRPVRSKRRLFGLLPGGQADAFYPLWNEFRAGQTPEARFARGLDALAPALLAWSGGDRR
nr:HD domain-containing protein [Deinococcus hopiensis]